MIRNLLLAIALLACFSGGSNNLTGGSNNLTAGGSNNLIGGSNN